MRELHRRTQEVQEAGEDWEHDEDSEEENERRQYENESGYRIEPFNTDMEREEGHFDESTGHYVEGLQPPYLPHTYCPP